MMKLSTDWKIKMWITKLENQPTLMFLSIIAFIVLIVSWDYVVCSLHGPTLSEWIAEKSKYAAMPAGICFCIGLLLGHLFWPVYNYTYK